MAKAGGAFFEIEHVRTLRRGVPQRGMWQGTRSFLAAESAAPGLALSLIDTLFPDLPDNRPAFCVQANITWHPGGVAGAAMILAHYQSRLLPGQIHIFYRTRPEGSIALAVDLDNNIIVGPTAWSTAESPSEWTIVSGSNRIPKIHIDLRVQTTVHRGRFDAGEVDPYVRTVNRRTVRIRDGRYPRGTLRLTSYHADDLFDSNYLDVNYFFSVNPNGWNEDLKVRRGELAVQQIETRDTSGALTGEVRDVLFFDPAVGEIEGRTLYKESSWTRIPDDSRW